MINQLRNDNSSLNPYIQIGMRISKVRKKNYLSLSELSKKIDISIDKLQKIESGDSKISMDILMKIANILNCDVSYFLTGLSNSMIKDKVEILTKYINAFKFINKLSPKQKDVLFSMFNSTDKK